jgi:hypothetical protein
MDTTYTDADIVYADENSWDNAGWTSDYINNYADIAYACVDDGQHDEQEQEQQDEVQEQEQQDEVQEQEQQDEVQENQVQNSTCIYNEPCSAERMCGDCCIDNFEREQNEDAWKNFKLDRKYNDTKY